MKRIIVIIILPLFLLTQYDYALTACYFCTERVFKDMEITRTAPEKVESLLTLIEPRDNPECINLHEAYTLQYLDAEFTYVPSYNGSLYLFIEREGCFIGAVNQGKGEISIILPKDMQPEGLCEMICCLVYGQSLISIVACFLLPMIIIAYPDDQELCDALFHSCVSGITAIIFSLGCSYELCH
jgi:hypothetical protein